MVTNALSLFYSTSFQGMTAYFPLPLYNYGLALKMNLTEDIDFFIHLAYLLYIYYISSTLLNRV